MTADPRSLLLFTSVICLTTVLPGCGEKSASPENGKEAKEVPALTSDMKMAYVNTDTLLEKYEMLKDLEEEMLQEKLVMENQFRQQVEQLEKEYAYAQKEAQNLPQDKLQLLQMEFAQKEQDLMNQKQVMEDQLMSSEKEKNDRYYAEIRAFLDRYAAAQGYHMIYGYNGFGNLLYMHKQYDITDLVVDSLNSSYARQKPQPSASK